MVCYYTESELLSERIKMLKKYKLDLKLSSNRVSAFNIFKRLCRDRVFDSVGGYCRTRDNVYYWGW